MYLSRYRHTDNIYILNAKLNGWVDVLTSVGELLLRNYKL